MIPTLNANLTLTGGLVVDGDLAFSQIIEILAATGYDVKVTNKGSDIRMLSEPSDQKLSSGVIALYVILSCTCIVCAALAAGNNKSQREKIKIIFRKQFIYNYRINARITIIKSTGAENKKCQRITRRETASEKGIAYSRKPSFTFSYSDAL